MKHAQNGGRRVPAHQPPARLPGLRQGRRVPAAGHLVRLGRRPLALHRAQAPLREAARALAAGGDRPRALHPLLPLRALLAGGRRGLPAGLPGARRPHVRRHVRRAPVRRAVQRQHHRAVPGGRADLAALPLPRAPVGHRGLGRASARSARSQCNVTLHGPRRARRARPGRATTTRSTTAGSATRAASATRRSTSRSASTPDDPRRRRAAPVSWERALDEAAAGLRRDAGRAARRPAAASSSARSQDTGRNSPPSRIIGRVMRSSTWMDW